MYKNRINQILCAYLVTYIFETYGHTKLLIGKLTSLSGQAVKAKRSGSRY